MARRRDRPARRAERAASEAGDLNRLFPKLTQPRKRFGVGVLLALAKREGDTADVRTSMLEEAFESPGRRPKAKILQRADAKNVARLLSGLSHADRIRVASAIMTGANTHRLLKESLGLKTGPLYHHVRGLQMAGMVTLASRNFYVLTELGETALMVATGLGARTERTGSTWKHRVVRLAGGRKKTTRNGDN